MERERARDKRIECVTIDCVVQTQADAEKAVVLMDDSVQAAYIELPSTTLTKDCPPRTAADSSLPANSYQPLSHASTPELNRGGPVNPSQNHIP